MAGILASGGLQEELQNLLAGMQYDPWLVDIPKLPVCFEIIQEGHSHRHPWNNSLIGPNLLSSSSWFDPSLTAWLSREVTILVLIINYGSPLQKLTELADRVFFICGEQAMVNSYRLIYR